MGCISLFSPKITILFRKSYSQMHIPQYRTGKLIILYNCLSLLQGIFPTQGLNPGLLHCMRILYQLSHKGSPYNPLAIHYFQSTLFSCPLSCHIPIPWGKWNRYYYSQITDEEANIQQDEGNPTRSHDKYLDLLIPKP